MGRAFVVNASPVILLTRIDHLDLLTALADSIVVPQSVLEELTSGSDRDRASEIVRDHPDLKIVRDLKVPETVQRWELGAGESQVLVHASSRAGSEAILDDLAARRCARALGVPVLGTLGVIATCRRQSIIPAARPVISALVDAGIRLTPSLIEAVLTELGEGS